MGLGADLLAILVINLVLSGDNAVVIAMAVRGLSRRQRLWGIIFGAGLAVLLRVLLTFVAARLLTVSLIKFAGGILLVWIAVRLLQQESREPETVGGGGSLAQAVKTIAVADVVMSTDNVLAVAAASRGDLLLLLFGLATSIPLVIVGAQLLSSLMDRFPVIVYLGAALLGKVAGEMMITDPMVLRLLGPGPVVEWAVQLFFAVAVVVVGRVWTTRRARGRPCERESELGVDLSTYEQQHTARQD